LGKYGSLAGYQAEMFFYFNKADLEAFGASIGLLAVEF
jgi:hypothetical protein